MFETVEATDSELFLPSWDMLGNILDVKGKAFNPQPVKLLSEESAHISEAAMRKFSQTLFSNPKEFNFMSRRMLLKSCLAMCVGVESSIFKVDQKTQSFQVPSRPDLRIESTSNAVYKEIIHQFASFGSHFFRLERLSMSYPSYKIINATELIFYDGLRSFLSLIRSSVLSANDYVAGNPYAGFLTVWNMIEPLDTLLQSMAEICECSIDNEKYPRNSEILSSASLLSRIHDVLVSLESQYLAPHQQVLQHVLGSLFKRACNPLTEMLSVLVGAQRGASVNHFESFFSPTVSRLDLDTAMAQIQDASLIPSFIPPKIVAAVQHSGFCLQLLRSFNPNHQLFLINDKHETKLDIVLQPSEVALYRKEVHQFFNTYSSYLFARESDVHQSMQAQILQRRNELINIQQKREEYVLEFTQKRLQKRNNKQTKWKSQVQEFLLQLAEYRHNEEIKKLQEAEEALQRQRKMAEELQAEQEAAKREMELAHSKRMADLEMKSMKADWALRRGELTEKRRNLLKEDIFMLEAEVGSIDQKSLEDTVQSQEIKIEAANEILESAESALIGFETSAICSEEEGNIIEETKAILHEETPVMDSAEDDIVAEVDYDSNNQKASNQSESSALVLPAIASAEGPDTSSLLFSASVPVKANVNSNMLNALESGAFNLASPVIKRSTCSCHGILTYLCPSPMLRLNPDDALPARDIQYSDSTSLDVVLEMTLFNAIYARCDLISQETLLVFIRDLKLRDELSLIGGAFFLKDFDFSKFAMAQAKPHSPECHQSLKEFLEIGTGVCGELNKRNSKFKLVRPVIATSTHNLSLQYFLKAPFDYLLTPQSIQKYNSLFSLLLQTKLCLADLHRLTLPRESGIKSSLLIRFRMEAIEFISSLLQYFHEEGLSPWHKFMNSLLACETGQSASAGFSSLSVGNGLKEPPTYRITDLKSLKTAHEMMLNQITWYLLLETGQKPMMNILLQVFEDVRRICESAAIGSSEVDQDIHSVRQKISIFIKVADKMKHLDVVDSGQNMGNGNFGSKDYGSLNSLLVFVNFNKYYSR
ncbi:Spc98 family-domain-containing protein [Obelidium mucronatum]|nr:Spc98 family-domain-containing protein [Obelidium mucronatum]